MKAPSGAEIVDGATATVSHTTRDNASMPTLTSSAVLWCQITCDGSSVEVKCLRDDSDAPTALEWSGATVVYDSSDFDFTGGMIGWRARSQFTSIDDLTVHADRDANGSYEALEHVERSSPPTPTATPTRR